MAHACCCSPQEPFLRKLLEVHGFAYEMNRKDFLALNWAPFLEKAATVKPQYRWLQSVPEPCMFLMPRAAEGDQTLRFLMPTAAEGDKTLRVLDAQSSRLPQSRAYLVGKAVV